MANPPSQVDSKVFAAHLHTAFTVQTNGGDSLSLELDAVRELPSPPAYEAFSLVFRGPAHTRLPQQTHRFEHGSLGSFEIFVTAIAGDAESISYEAVFARKRKQA
jgi:hypothetical protein